MEKTWGVVIGVWR